MGHKSIDGMDPDNASLQRQDQEQRRQYYLSQITVNKRPVTNEDLFTVSQQVGKAWKNLGRVLNFEEAALETFEYDYKDFGLQEIVYQLLQAWRKKYGGKASIRILAYALMKVDRRNAAILLQ